MKKLLSYYKSLKEEEFIANELNNFCKEKIQYDKCTKFYNNLLNVDDGVYNCPYNFNCIKKGDKIYNCLLIKGKYNQTKIKQKKGEKQRVFDEVEINNYIDIDNNIESITSNYERSFNNMNDFLHDITKVNKMIEDCSKNFSQENMSKKDKSKRQSIIHLSDFITKRIDLYRYVSNPEIIKIGRKRERDAYKLWDIYRYVFTEIGHGKNISIEMKKYNLLGIEENSDSTLFMANDSITTLPFLLIDNAIKYSQNNSVVEINFFQNNNKLKKIEVCSSPSYKIDENPMNFFARGYRALNNTSKSSGSGLGLSIVKQVCDFNDIDISIKVIQDEFGQQKFKVEMEVQEND